MAFVLLAMAMAIPATAAEPLKLRLRGKMETSPGSGRFHTLVAQESWLPSETALIVCDVWDLHHCLNAVRRETEMAPRLDRVLAIARDLGVTIIHAPSGCMDAYKDHPARRRATSVPEAKNLPKDITTWCSKIPAEERGVYPIDQSDGGEDDDPKEHAEWAAKLAAMGRNPNAPWKSQSDLITIDGQLDYISDRGDEVWNILENRGIKNVILTGVHTNMCVLGRPFGLRQMARNNKRVVLMRDMTDTMYNPKRWPYVSHFTGTDLIVAHIEKYVCPTITSDQILADEKPFRFKNDLRPHVVMVIAEDEYKTEDTLPQFGLDHLGQDYRVSYVFGSDRERNEIPGLDVLDDADCMLISVRRRILTKDSMAVIRRFVESGKPVIGLRTASHAFSLRNAEPPPEFVDWPDFDASVFGGNYHNHHGNKLQTTVQFAKDEATHPILMGVAKTAFTSGGSLYRTSPVADSATVLLTGRVEGHPPEPVAWTFERADGGRSFYSSLGHTSDFKNESFTRLLRNAIDWALKRPVRDRGKAAASDRNRTGHWTTVAISNGERNRVADLDASEQPVWYRFVLRVPAECRSGSLQMIVDSQPAELSAWLNGCSIDRQAIDEERVGATCLALDSDDIEFDDANLIVLRVAPSRKPIPLDSLVVVRGDRRQPLTGRWQVRAGDDPAWANMPLPAKFGASADIVFELE